MAEVWYAATGPKHWLDLHEVHMQGQSFWINGVSPNGQNFSQEMKGILEPVNLYRYVVPRAGVPIVLKTLGADSIKEQFAIKIMSAALRKSLGLNEIPKIDTNVKMSVSTDFLRIVPIGIKDDGEDRIIATTGVKQEPI